MANNISIKFIYYTILLRMRAAMAYIFNDRMKDNVVPELHLSMLHTSQISELSWSLSLISLQALDVGSVITQPLFVT